MRICALLLLFLLPVAVAAEPPVALRNASQSIALVDGKWIYTRTATVTGEVVLTEKATEVNVYANRLSQIKTVSGRVVTVVEDVLVEVVEIVTPGPERVFGLVDAPPGRYRIEILTNPGLKKRWEYLEIGDPAPPDPVDPVDPDPVDPPAPEAGPRFMLLLFESREQTPAQAALWAHLRRWDEGEETHRLVMLDKDVSADWVKAYKEGAKEYPWLVIQEDKDGGRILYKGKAPESKDSFLDLLQEHGG